jgi:hypothetical protein
MGDPIAKTADGSKADLPLSSSGSLRRPATAETVSADNPYLAHSAPLRNPYRYFFREGIAGAAYAPVPEDGLQAAFRKLLSNRFLDFLPPPAFHRCPTLRRPASV